LRNGILLDLLEHEPRRQALAEQPRQARLSHTDHTLDDDVAVLAIPIPSRRRQFQSRVPRLTGGRVLSFERWLSRVSPVTGMHQQRVELDQRNQHERAARELGVRHDQVRLLDDQAAVEQQVEVDGAGSVALGAHRPSRFSIRSRFHRQLARGELGVDLRHRVQEVRLIHLTRRLGVVERGRAEQLSARAGA
jgi:hypothetical protein